jgi:hypothetical protein
MQRSNIVNLDEIHEWDHSLKEAYRIVEFQQENMSSEETTFESIVEIPEQQAVENPSVEHLSIQAQIEKFKKESKKTSEPSEQKGWDTQRVCKQASPQNENPLCITLDTNHFYNNNSSTLFNHNEMMLELKESKPKSRRTIRGPQ